MARYAALKFIGTKRRHRQKRIQTEVTIPGLIMSEKNLSVRRRRAKRAAPDKRRSDSRFAVCIDNEGYPASLELGKIYRVIPDNDAHSHGLVRIIDESGEDYAYASNRFHAMKVPAAIEKVLVSNRR
jgi:hypothetical protein